MRRFFPKDIAMAVISIIVGILAWAVVLDIQNPEKTYEFKNILVVVNGKSELSNSGLSVITGENQRITVKVSGRRNDIAKMLESQ